IEAEHALLTNWEVSEVIKNDIKWCKKKERESKSNVTEKHNISGLRDVATLCYALQNYFKDSPTQYHTAESIQKLTKGMAPFGLTKAEKLQIVNNMPRSEVEIHVIVEEVEERLPENAWEEIVSAVEASILSAPTDADDTAILAQ
ncbi:hypothetical protein SARC_14252, partial [Sphaeroforma arctica JP610]